MKANVILVLAMSLLSFGAIAQAKCIDNLTGPVRFAIAYLSLLERGGLSYGEMYNSNGRTMDQICADMTSAYTSTSKSRVGYTDISLNFKDGSCILTAPVSDDGRVGADSEMNCDH